ncbi:MAG: hypothetical protein NTY41_00170, partial [Proteobacteria bacterium]|nr:hypothetical protein [Pseudomonadota bacterium]
MGGYVFTPLGSTGSRRPADFPRVSAVEQAARDADAEQIVHAEFAQDMPDENRVALEREYAQQFDANPPASASWKFTPLDDAKAADTGYKFVPLEPENPSLLKTIALNNPLTAAGEAAMNFGSQAFSLPIAGLAGIGTAAANAAGLTDKTGADAVRYISEEGTYQPRGEMGRAAAEIVAYPFQKLTEVGQGAGNRVLDATGSPVLATAVDTAINAAPMAIAPAAKFSKATTAKGLLRFHPDPSPQALQRLLRIPEGEAQAYFDAWQAEKAAKTGGNNGQVMGGAGDVRRMAPNQETVPGSAVQGFQALRRAGDNDLPAMAEQLPDIPQGGWTEARTEPVPMAGTAGYEQPLRAGERGLVEAPTADFQPGLLPQDTVRDGNLDYPGSRPEVGYAADDLAQSLADAERRPVPGADARTLALQEGYDVPDPQRVDLEHSGVGQGVERSGTHATGTATLRQPPAIDTRAAPTADAINESITRAERILNENGSLAGLVDLYNNHVNDGKLIESFKRNQDGGYTFTVNDGGKTLAKTVPAEGIPKMLEVLRNPAKIAEVEAR